MPSSSTKKLQMEELHYADYDSFFHNGDNEHLNSSKKAMIKQELFANYQVDNFGSKVPKFDDDNEGVDQGFGMDLSGPSHNFLNNDYVFDDIHLEKTLSMCL